MSKAEDRALERFPVHKGASKEWIEMHLKGVCAEYIEGYHQAEKDLELTWEDLALVEKIGKDFMRENDTPMNDEEFFGEVLKRYKIERKNAMNNKKQNATDEGKKFASEVTLDCWHVSLLGFKASVDIGEDYYETDPYQSKDLALCEVKGFLEGVKAKIEGVLQSIEREINEDNKDTTN